MKEVSQKANGSIRPDSPVPHQELQALPHSHHIPNHQCATARVRPEQPPHQEITRPKISSSLEVIWGQANHEVAGGALPAVCQGEGGGEGEGGRGQRGVSHVGEQQHELSGARLAKAGTTQAAKGFRVSTQHRCGVGQPAQRGAARSSEKQKKKRKERERKKKETSVLTCPLGSAWPTAL